MADKRSRRDSRPIPEDIEGEDESHDFNPVVDDDIVVPGIVPPEGHEFNIDDNEETGINESGLQDYERDLAVEYRIKTKYSDGSTWNPSETMSETNNQGLVYTPPDDPPVIPSDDLEGVEVGIGFAPSLLETNPDELDLPEAVDNQDWDLVEDVERALRMSSYTSHLDDIHIEVEDGVVTVRGTVPTMDDLGRAEQMISDLPGVRDVISEVELSDDSID
jgi:hypothetical protein